MHKPLAGIRIIAVEQYGAGPYGSMHLADLGAEVVKIENRATGGDISRSTGPFFIGGGGGSGSDSSGDAGRDSEFFQTFNLNKKSLALDLKDDRARAVFARLVAASDAVSNNLRGDQPGKLGLDYASLKHLNPGIVCAHLSAYGRDNDRANWPGYDYLMQAEGAFMHLTGEPGTPPTRFGLSMVDFMTGTVTSMALCAALLGVARGGSGCDLDISLFDVALHQLSYPATWYLNNGHVTERLPRSAHPSTVPCQLYQASDGWVFVMAMTPKFWTQLCAAVGRPDLEHDERFADAASRRENREQMTAVLDAEFKCETVAHWVQVLQGRVPVAPVYDLPQALENPYLQDIEMIRQVRHPQAGDLRVLGSPVRVNGERPQAAPCAPVGADAEEVLAGAGFDPEEIAALRKDGVI